MNSLPGFGRVVGRAAADANDGNRPAEAIGGRQRIVLGAHLKALLRFWVFAARIRLAWIFHVNDPRDEPARQCGIQIFLRQLDRDGEFHFLADRRIQAVDDFDRGIQFFAFVLGNAGHSQPIHQADQHRRFGRRILRGVEPIVHGVGNLRAVGCADFHRLKVAWQRARRAPIACVQSLPGSECRHD